jgi:acyl-CoA dehydrogenase
MPILLGGNSSQKERFFGQIAERNSLAAFALNEPDCGLEASSLKMKAEKQGSAYLLNGQKSFVTHGGVAQFYSVFAMTHPEQGHKGLSAFLVEREPQDLLGKREENRIRSR